MDKSSQLKILGLEKRIDGLKRRLDDVSERCRTLECDLELMVYGGGFSQNDPRSVCQFYSYPKIRLGKILNMILDKIGMKIDVQEKETTISLVEKDRKADQT